MAGKHISVTHVAGSSTKTMLNGGQTGVAAGVTAFFCGKYQTTPRGVYADHLPKLKTAMTKGVPSAAKIPADVNQNRKDRKKPVG